MTSGSKAAERDIEKSVFTACFGGQVIRSPIHKISYNHLTIRFLLGLS